MENSNKLALIYSKLAELELHQKKQPDLWKHIKQSYTTKQLEPEVVKNIEHVFYEACIPPPPTTEGRNDFHEKHTELSPTAVAASSSSSSSALLSPVSSSTTTTTVATNTSSEEKPTTLSPQFPFPISQLTSDTIKNIRVLFLAEQQFSNTLQQSITEKLIKLKTNQSTQEKLIPEILHYREDLVKYEKKLSDYEELCRNLQKLSKEKDEHRRMLVEHEQTKSKQLEQECLQSIDTVTKKIEEEENDLLITSNENEDLKMKLDSFILHLKIRKEKFQNEEKTKDLYFRLKEAKKSQFYYFIEQEKMKLNSYKSNIVHSKETIHHLKTQLLNFSNKFDEFEETLTKSSQVIEKVNERESILIEMFSKYRAENEQLKNKVTETDVLIIQTIEKKRQGEEDIVKLKQHLVKLEKKCRKVLSKRQQLMKEYDIDESILIKKTTPTPLLDATEATTIVATPTPVATITTPRLTPPIEPSSSSSSSTPAADRFRTESPTVETSNASKTTTPNRKIHNFVLSSSSASSPSRIFFQEAGEGSPVSSPPASAGKKKN